MFYVGIDDKIYHKWQVVPNGGWSGENLLAGPAKDVVVGQNQDGRLEVFYIGIDDKIYHIWQDPRSGGWSDVTLL